MRGEMQALVLSATLTRPQDLSRQHGLGSDGPQHIPLAHVHVPVVLALLQRRLALVHLRGAPGAYASDPGRQHTHAGKQGRRLQQTS